ncbi:MAG: hypothetical protein ACP5RP_03865 [Candidatus Micrarchaeia archaeon]
MNILSIEDVEKKQIDEIFEIADNLQKGGRPNTLQGKTAIMLFDEKDAMERIFLETAARNLGLNLIYEEMKIEKANIEKVSYVLNSYADIAIIKTKEHKNLDELSKLAGLPIINVATELEKPCGVLGDIYKMRSYKKNLNKMKIAVVGDISSNYSNTIMLAASKMGMEIALVGSKNLLPNALYFAKAREYGKIDTYNDIKEIADEADIFYTVGNASSYDINLESSFKNMLDKKTSAVVITPADLGTGLSFNTKNASVKISKENNIPYEALVYEAILLYAYQNKNIE